MHVARSFILAVRWTFNQPGEEDSSTGRKKETPSTRGHRTRLALNQPALLTGRTAAGETGRIIFGFFSSSWVLFLSERCLLFCHYKICIYFKTLCLSWRGGETERCTFIFWTKFAFVGQLAQKVGAKSGTLWGHKYTNTITLGSWAQFYSMFFFNSFVVLSFEDLGTHFVQSKLSSISTVGVVVVVEKYFKNGSRPSNQVTNKEKKTRKRKENSRSRAYISEASAVYRLIYQFKSDSDSIELQFATNTVCAKEAKLNGKRENKGGKVREAKRKKRHRRHRRYCATANIFKQTLRSRRWSSFPHQKIFPNDTQRERATEKERVLNLMVWLCVQHSVHWQTERKTTKSVKRARESDFRAKIKGNDDK